MRCSVIIYHGLCNVGSDVFQHYLQVQGYTLVIVQSSAELFDAIDRYAESAVVLAMSEPATYLINLASELRTHAEAQDTHLGRIFVLADPTAQPSASGIEVIVPPFRLKQVATRIEALAREPA